MTTHETALHQAAIDANAAQALVERSRAQLAAAETSLRKSWDFLQVPVPDVWDEAR